MNPGIKQTLIAIASVTVMVISYDIFAVLKWGIDATVSNVIVEISKKLPIIPFAFGMLMGHFFTQFTNQDLK